MNILYHFNRIRHIGLLFVFISAVVSCSGGNQSDSTQTTENGTGAVSFQILFEQPQGAPRNAQSMDACDDVKWVKATILDQSGNVLKDGPNWNCMDRSGVLTDVPAGPDRRIVVYGIGNDDESILYRGEKTSFTVSPNKTNETGTIAALPIEDVDQDGDGHTPNGGDCNDNDESIFPGAEDLCNDEIDQDCNPDTCIAKTWYADRDNDGYGNSSETTVRVQCPEHYVAEGGDCNDDAGSIHPEANEKCNGFDDDCDGVRDEGCPWNKTYDGGDYYNNATSIKQTSDNGYIFFGKAVPGPWSTGAQLVIKTDEIGVEQWRFERGNITDIIQSTDGCYILTGGNALLLKIDAEGKNILFDKTFRGDDYSHTGVRILESNDGGYVIAGEYYTSSGISGVSLTKTDKNGDETWHIDLDEPDSSIQINSITSEDGRIYLVAGSIKPPNETTVHPYLIVADSDSKQSWRSIIEAVTGEAHSVTVHTITDPPLTNYFIAGASNEQNTGEIWLFVTDWQGTYSGFYEVIADIEESVRVNAITPTKDGGHIIAGENNGKALIIKTDPIAGIEFQKTIGGDYYASAIDVIESNDGGYVLLGDIGNKFWVVKTDANGNAPQ